MHVTKSGWAGQAFALATSNDSGGRKSRIRRSKEERKTMVESFIKKYQKSNNGNFPSLNLTHKEVGGSFYTVREIVREIIQENRVLAPPKVLLEEYDHSRFLQEHPLGSISIEPQIDMSVSDRIHMAARTMPNKYQIANEENISSSSVQTNGSYPLEASNDDIIIQVGQMANEEEVTEKTNKSNHTPHYQDTKSNEFEDVKIVNGFEVLQENPLADKPVATNIDHQDNNGSALLSSNKIDGQGSQTYSNEQYHNENEQIVDKNNEFGQIIYTESAVVEILDRDKYGAQDIEASQAIKSHVNSNVVVETFPLRPVVRTIHNMDEESGNLQEAAITLDDDAVQHDKMTFVQSSAGFANEKREEKLPDLAGESNIEYRDEKVALNIQSPSLETSNYQSASKVSVLDIGNKAKLESKDSLSDETKTSSSTERLISEDSVAVERKVSDNEKSSVPKGNNPMLDRINLETWKGASRKSSQHESNPLLALVKAFISSFVKFWTE